MVYDGTKRYKFSGFFPIQHIIKERFDADGWIFADGAGKTTLSGNLTLDGRPQILPAIRPADEKRIRTLSILSRVCGNNEKILFCESVHIQDLLE